MATAETRLGKPLLLEEFGKRLPPGELEAGAIAKQRDPVFETSFAAVAKSIAMCAVNLLPCMHDCEVMKGLTCGHPACQSSFPWPNWISPSWISRKKNTMLLQWITLQITPADSQTA